MSVILTGLAIEHFRLTSILSALRLEVRGIKHSRGSVCAAVKRQYGFKGNKAKVAQQFEAYLTQWRAEHRDEIIAGTEDTDRG